MSPAVPLHLLTAGFIVLTVFGVGVSLLAAFSGAKPPARVAWAMAATAIPAPLGIAAGLGSGRFEVVALFGILGLAGAALFACAVVWFWRKQRRRRAAWWLLLAGSGMLLAGEALGVMMAANPALRSLAATHGQINVVGFAGLLIFGVLFELSGGRAARPGVVTPGMCIAFVWPAALGARLAGAYFEWGALAALGSIALLASLALAAIDARQHKGTAPPPFASS